VDSETKNKAKKLNKTATNKTKHSS